MPYNKYAFISYQRKDARYAKMLSLRMSFYRLPHGMSNEFRKSRWLTPVWRDRDELTSGGELTPEIMEAIDTSKYLIVFCSENSLSTPWVNYEVGHFLKTHDVNHVIPYVLPTKGKEICYVENLAKAIEKKQKEAKAEGKNYVFLDIRHEQEELEIGFLHRLIPWLFRLDKSYVRVIARTLDLKFSEVWNAHNKFIRRVIRFVLAFLTIITAIGLWFGMPISMALNIRDVTPNVNLPHARNIILKVARAEYPMESVDTIITLNDIPGKYRFCDIPVEITATYYKPINTIVNPGIGLNKTCDIFMQRDSTFAIYYGLVTEINAKPVSGAYVKIGDKETLTNADGVFRLTFDIAEQSYSKRLYIEKSGVGKKDIAIAYPDSSQFILR